MKPAPFAYTAVHNVAEAVASLQRHGAEAKLIAGGQSLIPAMNMRLARPACLVDITPIQELDYIRETPDGLAIGALTRHRTVELSEQVRRVNPLIQEAVKYIGHFQIRNRGTIGGSLAHSDPAAEYMVVARALDAAIVVTGPGGERVIPAAQFFLTYFSVDLRPGELITEVRFPALRGRTGYAFVEVTRRHGDFAIVSVAATVTLDESGAVREARLALGGVGGVPHRAGATAALVGHKPDAGLLAAVATRIAAEVQPESDATASADYRAHLAGVLSRRALETALARAEGGK